MDFKKAQYIRENFHELIIDIMAMANSSYKDDKYIILGVKDKPDGTREIFGVNREEFVDSSIYQNVILDARYMLGVSKLYKSSVDLDGNNPALVLSVGYKFDINKL